MIRNRLIMEYISELPPRDTSTECVFCGDPCHDPQEVALSMHAECFQKAERLLEEDDAYLQRAFSPSEE